MRVYGLQLRLRRAWVQGLLKGLGLRVYGLGRFRGEEKLQAVVYHKCHHPHMLTCHSISFFMYADMYVGRSVCM